ncbi:hypothetical protein [uncultured Enterococcus sp.]|uniref:hypothetical protein n=1 Tax=uncultured Enterococcus sp. TaxID=167972 RepID=UPI002AA6ACC8|nr:hypothetical protein [uncultured Enterococcus sp.]
MEWHEIYGGYAHTGNYGDVYLMGSPNSRITNFNGDVPLDEAHSNGFGYGIGFENDGYDVTIALNLVTVSMQRGDGLIPRIYNRPGEAQDGCYVFESGEYHWVFQIDVSADNQGSWTNLHRGISFTHQWQFQHIYSPGGSTASWGHYYNPAHNWLHTARNSQFQRMFPIPENTTHVRFTITGEDSAYVGSAIFPIEVLIPDFRPMAIRKSGKFLTLDRETGFLNRRVNGSWEEIPKMKLGEQGEANVGTSRIRKGGTWKGQSKIGE